MAFNFASVSSMTSLIPPRRSFRPAPRFLSHQRRQGCDIDPNTIAIDHDRVRPFVVEFLDPRIRSSGRLGDLFPSAAPPVRPHNLILHFATPHPLHHMGELGFARQPPRAAVVSNRSHTAKSTARRVRTSLGTGAHCQQRPATSRRAFGSHPDTSCRSAAPEAEKVGMRWGKHRSTPTSPSQRCALGPSLSPRHGTWGAERDLNRRRRAPNRGSARCG
jgi:hypothetical protein